MDAPEYETLVSEPVLSCQSMAQDQKSIPMRKTHIGKIKSVMKGWLHQDMLIKPQEEILFRPRKDGGLGLQHVQSKAMAGMIRTFMETAANPKFQRRLDHQALYLHKVKGDKRMEYPHYYT